MLAILASSLFSATICRNFFLEAQDGMHHIYEQIVFSPSIGLLSLDNFPPGNIETASEYLNEHISVL
jgi:hypothetical protein